MTSGCITKVAYGDETKRAVVVQSSSAVHRGCSGGALINAVTGELVGLVTTNVKHQDGTVMPHVNHSLPVSLLSPLRNYVEASAQRGMETKALSALIDAWGRSAADPQEQSIWRLEPEALSLPSHVEERKQQAMDRMARLAEEADGAKAEDDLGAGSAGPGEVGQAVPASPSDASIAGPRRSSSSPPPRSSL